ncbi:hypothetical protein GRJ2_003399300 [Grus japonensis]|uniref:RNase H type-1 domain-containing protein n=1 Tax=Grus japonensis TaxID=30415 RepID=A0ABC9YHD4_GRUJA
MDVATQTELPQKHAATQVSGCRECQSLSLGMDGSSENGHVRCDQVDDLLSLVAELREEVERLRSIREAEKEIDWCSQALPSLRQKQGQTPDKTQDQGDPVSFPCQDEGSSLKERSEWRQIHARGSRQTSSLPTSPSQVPLYNRYEALAVEGQLMDDVDDGPSTPEMSPRSERPTPHIMTTSTRKKSNKLDGSPLYIQSVLLVTIIKAAEGQGESSQFAEVKAIQLALDIAEREKWPTLYLYTGSWMVANALWGWLQQWKQSNWQRRGKPIWAAPLWQDIAARLEKLVVKVHHVDAHVPKSRATEEHQNNQQVDQAAKIEVAQVDLDWQHKGELFIARWAHDTSGHQGRDATYRWARDRGVDLSMDTISQVIHQCETCAAIKQAKRVKPVWYGGRWLKYKYGEA